MSAGFYCHSIRFEPDEVFSAQNNFFHKLFKVDICINEHQEEVGEWHKQESWPFFSPRCIACEYRGCDQIAQKYHESEP